MFDNGQKHKHCRQNEIIEEFDHKPILISIPKIEPIYPSTTDLIEDTMNVEEFQEEEITSIPLITPHKLKDPVILLERCDKIWETLKVIKNVQGTTKIDTSNALLPETKTSKPLYIEYEPVLGNNNTELPNFKFSVKSKKKLFHCTICGKQYTENRRLRYHSERIHGIYIAPRRYKSIDKEKEKEFNFTEKEEDNSEKVSLKKSENKQLTVASLQHVSSSSSNIVVSDLYLKGSKFTNRLICSNNDVNINGTMKNEEKKLIKEVKQTDKVNSMQLSATSSTCTLCKQFVKDIKKHLIDYHKIESPDFMLKNLNETYTNFKSNKLKRRLSNDENETSGEIVEKDHNTQNKRQSTQHCVRSGTRQCDICLGLYTLGSFYGHVRIHRMRGETKENFHLSRSRHNYYNSPYCISKSKSISIDTSNENTNNCSNKNNSNLFKNKERSEEIVQNENRDNKISNIKCYERKNETSDDKNICSCGRTFRNPHTLFMHKRVCTLLVDANQPIVENNIIKKNQDISRNKNSGMGISITIKKRNNSYEIIDKDNKNEDRLQDSKNFHASSNTFKDNNQMELQDDSHEILELSKYSEKHSILKIQSADENIDIDIEEDSQINSYNDNISSSMNEVENNLCEQQAIKIEPNDEFYKNNVNSKLLKEKAVFTRSNCKKSNNIKVNFSRKYNICVCGSKFYTRKALKIHTNKHHHSSKLLCGYCKISFPDIVTWNEHQCSVNEGKRFIALPMQIKCHCCNEILNTCKKFDEHMMRRHFNSVVPFQCFQCDKRFSTTTNRKIHIDADHGVTICSICNNQYYDNMISRHEAYHYGLGFPCHLCKQTYSSKGSLLRHWRNIHGNKYIYSIDRIPDLYEKSHLEFLIYMKKKGNYPKSHVV